MPGRSYLFVPLLGLALLLAGCSSTPGSPDDDDGDDGSIDRDADGTDAADRGSGTPSDSSEPPEGRVTPPRIPAPTGRDSASNPAPDTSEQTSRVDRAALASLRETVKFTEPQARDARNPAWVVEQFLAALQAEDDAALRRCLHIRSGLPIPSADNPMSPACWSMWRVTVGRYQGIAEWGIAGRSPMRVAVRLLPAREVGPTTILLLQVDPRNPLFNPTEREREDSASLLSLESWRIDWILRTLDPSGAITTPVVRGLESRVTQPEFPATEAVDASTRLPEGGRHPIDVVRDMIAFANSARADVRDGLFVQRLLREEARAATDPGCDLRLPGDLARAEEDRDLPYRVQLALRTELPLAACIVLDRFRLAGAPTVYTRTLLVFGRPDGIRRVYRVGWRTVGNLYVLASLEPITPPGTLDELLAAAPAQAVPLADR